MHGLGNDFVVIDGISQRVRLDDRAVRRLADRHEGVGCDQVLLVEPPPNDTADFLYRIFNADGNEVQQCGNGARCFAQFVRDQGLSNKDEIRVSTAGGLVKIVLATGHQATVDMGVPRFEPTDIPLLAASRANHYELDLDGDEIRIGAVSMGNPHALVEVDSVDSAPVADLGPRIERHPRFPEGVNVGFVQFAGPSDIRLRVFERGVGETLACGSGACAAVAWGRITGRVESRVNVGLRGGALGVLWEGEGKSLSMTGPATRVFDGTIEI